MGGRYRAYPEYKDSGVGWIASIPEDWPVFKLGYLINTIVPMRDKPILLNGDIPWVRIEDFSGKYIFGSKSRQGVNHTTINEMHLKVFPVGTVLCSCSCSMGRTAIVAKPLISNQTFIGLVPEPLLDSEYLYYLIQASEDELTAKGAGAIQQYLSKDEFKSLKFAFPSLGEQTQIANFLDHETAKIDTLIEKQQQLIKLLKEKRQAVISHAVTKGLNPDAPMKNSGVEWLGEVPEQWDLPKLIHKTTNIGDGLHSTPKYQDGAGYYFVNGNNLMDGKIEIGLTAKEVSREEFEKHYVHLDRYSVLLSINGTIGNVALYGDEPIILGKSAAYMNCAYGLLPKYLIFYLMSSNLKHYYGLEVTGTTIYNLSLNSIRQMKVCVPPENEQDEIAKFCLNQKQKYEMLMNKANSVIHLMNERRTALISAAVTGKIDVRNWQPPEQTQTNKEDVV